MSGDFISYLFAEVAQSFRKDDTGSTGEISKLLHFLSFGFYFLNFLDSLFNGFQSIINFVSMFSVLVYPWIIEFLAISCEVVFEDI